MVIKAIFCDFDGVFTDNSVWTNERGEESVRCNRSDGIGISSLKAHGIYFCIISSEVIPIAKYRAKKLQIDCYTGVKEKDTVIESIKTKLCFKTEECAFIGNDINDLPAFKSVGIKIAVSDSYKQLLDKADHILSRPGGYGAVREACEYIMNLNK